MYLTMYLLKSYILQYYLTDAGKQNAPIIMKKLIFIILIFFSTNAFADYYVTGKITGGHKKYMGFAIEIVNVDAVGKKGDLYNLQRVYKKVSDYKNDRCWIDTRLGQIGKVLNFFRNQNFYERQSDGTYRKLNLEYITFPCVKR